MVKFCLTSADAGETFESVTDGVESDGQHAEEQADHNNKEREEGCSSAVQGQEDERTFAEDRHGKGNDVKSEEEDESIDDGAIARDDLASLITVGKHSYLLSYLFKRHFTP